MILQALHQLAEDESLVPDLDFEVKPVSWIIALQPNGDFVEFRGRRKNLNEDSKKKPKWVGLPMLVPRQVYRSGSKAKPYFLCDNAKFVLGVNIDKEPFVDRSSQAANDRFVTLIQECNEAVSCYETQAILEFYKSTSTSTLKLPGDVRPNDLFCFQIGQASHVHSNASVVEWWKQHSREAESSKSTFQCLVTGKAFGEVEQFPQIGPVPGALKPIKLVSFNRTAFTSHGMKGNENAPITRSAGIHVATAMNRLLHSAYPCPHNSKHVLPRRNFAITADTAACFWASSAGEEVARLLDAIPHLFGCDSEDAFEETYRCFWKGKAVRLKKQAAFYALVISGSQGRAIVRDWIETTVEAVSKNLAAHFDDLSIVRNTRPEKGTVLPPIISLKRMVESIATEGNSESVSSSLEAGLLRSAFTGVPYPIHFLQRALVRARAEAGRDDWSDAVRRDSRAAIVRAVLNRRRRFDPLACQRYPKVPKSMNPNLESNGYSLGMLTAVLERLQQLASGSVTSSVADRGSSAAASNPRAAFIRLLKNSRHHAEKVAGANDKSSRVLGQRLERIIDWLCSRFVVSGQQSSGQIQGIPVHLNLEQQGLFVLGYHQMRHWIWMSKADRKDWERKHSDASAVFVFEEIDADAPVAV